MAVEVNWIEYLTTNQAVEGSNPSSVTKSKLAQKPATKVAGFFYVQNHAMLASKWVGT
jgi:hypothetical protein